MIFAWILVLMAITYWSQTTIIIFYMTMLPYYINVTYLTLEIKIITIITKPEV